jgi:hypothetical protein
VPRLAAHISDTYGTDVTETAHLDLGIYRVDRSDGPSWVARVFPSVRPREYVDGDADILRVLAELNYPAERLAAGEPVSVLEDQAVLVTEYVTPGGAWHHLDDGDPRAEGEAVRALVEGAASSVGFGGDLSRVDRAVDGYRRQVTPEPEALTRLDTLVPARPIVSRARAAFASG